MNNNGSNNEHLDSVGYWTEVKLSILEDYAKAYAQILSKQQAIKAFVYIDGFAGAGVHISKATGKEIKGSPSVALSIDPPFSHYHFIDLDGQRANQLRALACNRNDVTVHEGDCNHVLLENVFPLYRYEDFRRALCLLDPYQLNPSWAVVKKAAEMKSIEIFLNFMIMDLNMNIVKRNPDKIQDAQITRMNTFWGDESWLSELYSHHVGLFEDIHVKKGNAEITASFKKRLKETAGFKYVPHPLPMRNSKGAIIYYLYFASNNKTGDKIARAIFKKYANLGMTNGH